MAIKEIFEGNTADILEATELLKVLGDREGQFVWKQLTAEGGDFVAYVTADAEDAYPDKGTHDGFYYVKFDPLTAIAENIREGVSIFDIIGTMSEGVSGVDMGEITLTSNLKSFRIEHSLNTKPRYAMLLPTDKVTEIQGGTVGYLFMEDFMNQALTPGLKYPLVRLIYSYGIKATALSTSNSPTQYVQTSESDILFTAIEDAGFFIGTYDWVVIA